MKTRSMMMLSALLAALVGTPAFAHPGPGMAGMSETGSMGPGRAHGMPPGALGPQDCSQAADPAACTAYREAHTQAFKACREMKGPERRQCMGEQMQKFDCSKVANPQRCEARKKVYKECQGKTGPAFRQCVRDNMPPPDCSQAADPGRCRMHQNMHPNAYENLHDKVRAACKDKAGPEHMACLREQFGAK